MSQKKGGSVLNILREVAKEKGFSLGVYICINSKEEKRHLVLIKQVERFYFPITMGAIFVCREPVEIDGKLNFSPDGWYRLVIHPLSEQDVCSIGLEDALSLLYLSISRAEMDEEIGRFEAQY